MGFFSFVRDDRVVFAGLGLATVGVVTAMRFLLAQYRDASEIKPIRPKTQYITQETEDSLKLETLGSLLGHYNFVIRETAARIVCDRAVNDGTTIHQLLWGITRPDYEERMQNLGALKLITDQHSLHLLHNPKAYLAFVRSLELCVGDVEYEKLDDKYFDEYPFRDAAEKMCLMFILQLIIKYDAKELIMARFVEKWLARQAWGDTDEERRSLFAQYMEHKRNRITDICQKLQESRLGRQALEKAKLLPEGSRAESKVGFRLLMSADLMPLSVDAEEYARTEEEYALAQGLQPRVMEQSAEEQRLRHNHRHTMVWNDGTHPLGRDDIIQPDRD